MEKVFFPEIFVIYYATGRTLTLSPPYSTVIRSSDARTSRYIVLRYSIASWHHISAEEKEQIVHGEQGDATTALLDLLIPP